MLFQPIQVFRFRVLEVGGLQWVLQAKVPGRQICLSLRSSGESTSCLGLFQHLKAYIPWLVTPLDVFKVRALQLPILLTCLPPSFSFKDSKDAFVIVRTLDNARKSPHLKTLSLIPVA